MEHIRFSTPADIPALRRLWKLAFGDSEAYMDNFFQNYYRPQRMIVLEEEGAVRAMTAWFDTSFVLPGREDCRAAYLYAVATHPEFRGRGLAGALLAGADQRFRAMDIPAVTTVPAQPSLHNFFAANGFRECFTLDQLTAPLAAAEAPGYALELIGPEEYTDLRERALKGLPHIAYPVEAVKYQQGCCLSSGGGLYRGDTPWGPVLLCAEGDEEGRLLGKELLGPAAAVESAAACLRSLLPGAGGLWRRPGEGVPFGMLKWLDPSKEAGWDWSCRGFLGLAFD